MIDGPPAHQVAEFLADDLDGVLDFAGTFELFVAASRRRRATCALPSWISRRTSKKASIAGASMRRACSHEFLSDTGVHLDDGTWLVQLRVSVHGVAGSTMGLRTRP